MATELAHHDSHDAHGHHDDPNAAPTRSDVKESFGTGATAFALVLIGIATVVGTFLGVTLVNN